jgi:2-oxoglutarate ferredoxin oxidoreductase subunit alpha
LGSYTEDSDEYLEVVDRLARKWETAKQLVPRPELSRGNRGATWGIVAVGSSDLAVIEAIAILKQSGIHLNYCRIRAYPFSKEVERFLAQHERVFVIEQNRDAQLKSLLVWETDYPKKMLQSILSYGGLPIDCGCIVDTIRAAYAEEEAA